MKRAAGLLLCLTMLLTVGCDQYVSKEKYDTLQKENQTLKAETAKLREQLNAKPKHNYTLHRAGNRTFRFDSETGQSCIMLAPESDWKRKDVKGQSCACEDMFEETDSPPDILRAINCGY